METSVPYDRRCAGKQQCKWSTASTLKPPVPENWRQILQIGNWVNQTKLFIHSSEPPPACYAAVQKVCEKDGSGMQNSGVFFDRPAPPTKWTSWVTWKKIGTTEVTLKAKRNKWLVHEFSPFAKKTRWNIMTQQPSKRPLHLCRFCCSLCDVRRLWWNAPAQGPRGWIWQCPCAVWNYIVPFVDRVAGEYMVLKCFKFGATWCDKPILFGEASGSHHRKHTLRLFSAGSRWIWRPSAPKSPANFSSMKLESGQVSAVFFTVTCSYTVHNLRTLLSCSWEKCSEISGCLVWALHHLHLIQTYPNHSQHLASLDAPEMALSLPHLWHPAWEQGTLTPQSVADAVAHQVPIIKASQTSAKYCSAGS